MSHLSALQSLRALTAACVCGALLGLAATPASAKLPPPSDEAKAKAAEAAALTAHNGKVDAFKLCQSMDKVAARYRAEAAKGPNKPKAPTATPPCTDPGKFVYTPAAAAPAAPAAAVAAAPAAAPAKK